MSHKFSIEKLYHFRCGVCSQWWTIGDFDDGEGDEMCCPKCGNWCDVEEIKEENNGKM